MSTTTPQPIEAETLYRVCLDKAGIVLSLEDSRGNVIWVQDSDDVIETALEVLECSAEHLLSPFPVDGTLQVVDRSRMVFEVIRVDTSLVLLDSRGEPLIWGTQEELLCFALSEHEEAPNEEDQEVRLLLEPYLDLVGTKLTEYRSVA